MKSYQYDISPLLNSFSSSGTTNLFNSINLADYASIKNGSYSQLVKKYYATCNTEESDSIVQTKGTNSKSQNVATTGFTQVKKSADQLKKTVDQLSEDDLWKQTNGSYDTDKIAGTIKSFVSNYNSTISLASNINAREVTQDINNMKSMTSVMSKALSKVGISIDTDGKLSINDDVLKKAEGSDLKSLFSGKSTYGAQIGDYASNVSKDALMNSSTYNSNGSLSSSLSSVFSELI